MHGLQRRIEQQLGEHALARRQGLAFEQGHAGRYILGAKVHVYSAEMFKRAGLTWQQVQLDIHPHAGRV
ncbi:hypothetical protein D3C76_1531290 [compost metagenome]